MIQSDSSQILLVEDNQEDAELAVRAIRRAHLANAVLLARDGAEAIDLLLGPGSIPDLPRVVLLDLKLPKVDGLEVLSRLRNDARTSKLPIVMLTSSAEEPDIRRAYELGANSYVVKPVEFERFTAAVGEIGTYWLTLNQPPA